jgi:hypothetical protein
VLSQSLLNEQQSNEGTKLGIGFNVLHLKGRAWSPPRRRLIGNPTILSSLCQNVAADFSLRTESGKHGEDIGIHIGTAAEWISEMALGCSRPAEDSQPHRLIPLRVLCVFVVPQSLRSEQQQRHKGTKLETGFNVALKG